jgi:hypothetical protein
MVGSPETKARAGLTVRLVDLVGEKVPLREEAIRPVDRPSPCVTRRPRKRQAQSQ